MYSENIAAVNLYQSCNTQWRYSATGLAIGFDYSGVKQVMKLTKIKNKADAFKRLQILENETLKIRAEKQKE